MIDKNFLVDDTFVIGMYFQNDSSRLTIGGNTKFVYTMRIIIEEYFKFRKYQMINTARNKCKFILYCDKRKYFKVIRQMKNDGIIFKKTNNFNRIWW